MSNSSFDEQVRVRRNQKWSSAALAAKENSEKPDLICRQWSSFADEVLTDVFNHYFQDQKIALFALGKLGSEELNLSSDVDILFIAEEVTTEILSGLRHFQRSLNERTPQGFVFRLDFDLRPGGRQGPLIPTLDEFKDYYGNYGETWERLALVRLRAICGDPDIADKAFLFAKKFSFRRHLDFTLLEDLKGLRGRIQDHYWNRAQDGQIDLKLGVGGIRDVELFVHALLVVHGGKDPSLQVRGTTEALVLLEQKKLLPSTEALFLSQHYWHLRLMENYVQALNDEQTHLLNIQEQHPDFIARMLPQVLADMHTCDSIVKELLGEPAADLSLENQLISLGIHGSELEELWQEIMGQEVRSRHRLRDEESRKLFLREFLQTLERQGGQRKRALLLLKDFVHNTRAKASFFSLLLREKDLLHKLTWLFGHSPYLSRILCNRPELLDSFVFRSQGISTDDWNTLLEGLTEKRLLSEIINGSEFLESRQLEPLLLNLSSTADSVTETLLAALKKEFPSSIEILTLGKWGGQELGFRSDLDFIFVLHEEATDADYKCARRFISRLTEPHRGGSIYPIDMRLRPSGKAGPLVMPLVELQEYLAQEAPPWERQAYLKGRWLGGEGPSLKSLYISKGLTFEEMLELNRVRQALIRQYSSFDLKYSEGGMVDLELASQTVLLAEKREISGTSTPEFLREMGKKGEQLALNYNRLRQIEQMLQLVIAESISELKPDTESLQLLAAALQISPETLLAEVSYLLEDNIQILKELDPRRSAL